MQGRFNMKKIAFFVHGFNVSDNGANTIDKLKPYFKTAGYKIIEFDYEWTGVLRVRLCNKNLAKALASVSNYFYNSKCVAIGHSNGCAIIHEACKKGARFSQVVYINPALNKDASLSSHIIKAHVWHSPSDKPVKVARWLINHSWGEMGATGYTGKDKRYINYDKENNYRPQISRKHSDVFEPDKIKFFGPLIVNKLEMYGW